MRCIRQAGLALPLAVVALVPALLAACDPDRNTGYTKAEVLQVQAERFQAVVDADVAALDAVLAQELVYTHSTGRVESKADFMESVGSGSVDYLELSPHDTRVRIYDDVAVINGDVELRVTAGGQEHRVSMRYNEVYVHKDGRWQLVAWQSTQSP